MSSNSPVEPHADSSGHKSSEQQTNRACEACRTHKVRCLPESSAPGKCQRCAKTNRECIFAAPQRRRPRKRAEVRMAELEKEVRAMRAMLKDGPGQHSPTSADRRGSAGVASTGEESDTQSTGAGAEDEMDSLQASGLKTVTDGPISWSIVSGVTGNSESHALKPDIIERGILSLSQAAELINAYSVILVEQYPVVILPEGTTATHLRESQPLLFLAVLTAASLRQDHDLATKLSTHLRLAFAEQVFIKCTKTRELVQALIVTVAFYNPPDNVKNIQVFQYAHFAAAMAMDVGLGYRPTAAKGLALETPDVEKFLKDDSLVQDSRTILACWLSTGRIATRTRRPSLLPFTNWMTEAMTLLEKSKKMHDQRMVAFIKLQQIAVEAATSFGFDDASTAIELTPLRMQVIIKAFERRMKEWKQEYTHLVNVSLSIEYHSILSTIYEFAMDGGRYDWEQAKRRNFNLTSLRDDSAEFNASMPLSPLEIDATVKCITATHEILELVMGLDTQSLRDCPNMFCVHTTYSLAVLLRLHCSFVIGSSDLSELVDADTIKYEHYMNTILERYREAGAGWKYRIPFHWYEVTSIIRDWYERNKVKLMQKAAGKKGNQPKDSLLASATGASMPMNASTTLAPPPQGGTYPDFTAGGHPLTPNSHESPDMTNANIFMNYMGPIGSWLDPMDLGGGSDSIFMNDFPMTGTPAGVLPDARFMNNPGAPFRG